MWVQTCSAKPQVEVGDEGYLWTLGPRVIEGIAVEGDVVADGAAVEAAEEVGEERGRVAGKTAIGGSGGVDERDAEIAREIVADAHGGAGGGEDLDIAEFATDAWG